ncbi:MAG TPA: RNA polymerase subunit sigma-24 [Ktedonobacter sp.]|jgi:RNA polymerase sigma-70 factor (ECF subfamily)|nr:RNA polymerase subunit sigma-24 [Ktedonobacter sp.]HAG99242.1 RNA polymerase subunit sigma-24 [Ktedonobacter sp.]HAT46533.1 RNA polymerase subunit sigma-24 [Ktedonobacter sp.]HBE24999.1 RNA polymerase subunit sigma-24 [Ktedonobacter sp.]HBE29074.1 RNA polymerase subunit sigma-24 [Ktedonobacter sp.]
MDNHHDVNQITGHSSLAADEQSDEALILAIAGGAVWAMEPLYQRYSRILYSMAYRMVSDHQIAEDLIQEAFLSVWRRAISYSPQSGAVRSWLISIVHHRTIDYLRSVRRRSVMKEATWEEVEQDDRAAVPDVWDEAWRSIQSSQVRAALMDIPTEQRMVIELAYFQGWTHTEIAEGCLIPLGTVKARMRLGLKHLKRGLEKMGVNEM